MIRPLPGLAVVATAGGDGSPIKTVDGVAITGLKCQVNFGGIILRLCDKQLIRRKVPGGFGGYIAAERGKHVLCEKPLGMSRCVS